VTDEREPEQRPEGTDRWKSQTAVLVILVLLALVVYVTLKTAEIPVSVALPLLAAAAFGLWAFRWSDFKG
jgi:hypothetical protein